MSRFWGNDSESESESSQSSVEQVTRKTENKFAAAFDSSDSGKFPFFIFYLIMFI